MMIYEAEKSFREHPVTAVWKLKKQGELKWNIKYPHSQFSNKHIIFKFKIVIFDNPWSPSPGTLSVKKVIAFLSSMLTSTFFYWVFHYSGLTTITSLITIKFKNYGKFM